jgi:hypothetical protein
MPELGVATAAQIHLGLSSTNIHHDCDTCGSLYFDNDCEGDRELETDTHTAAAAAAAAAAACCR